MAGALREGFTTGSAATGAALAALRLLREGAAPAEVRVPLPPFDAPASHATQPPQPRAWLRLTPSGCALGAAPELAAAWSNGASGLADPPPANIIRMAHADIIKDGGDDPDATSGARITATVVESAPAGEAEEDAIIIRGGPGVGRVTLPGLPVPVGEAAVNPVPRRQIALALTALLHAYAQGSGPGIVPAPSPITRFTVYVSVPDGARLARKTFNPRLGIEGGISILGTQGTVRPYSHDAWKATIAQGLAVAAATGCDRVCLTTGRRSERLLMERYPALPARCFVQVADFAEFSLRAAGAENFSGIVWGCFFGKLVKLAQGHPYTHAGHATLDMRHLASMAAQTGAACAAEVARCITAAQALELLLADRAGPQTIALTARRAARVAQDFAGRPVTLHLFHTDGRELLAL